MRVHTAAMAAFLLLAAPLMAGTNDPLPSDTCGSCHRDIYRMWRDSAHAQALDNPFFLEPLARLTARYGAARTQVCVDCHAPLARTTDDLELRSAISREGVSCEYCHGLADVSFEDGVVHSTLRISNIKYGPIPHAESPGHGVAYSALHSESIVCAPCHEHRTPAGVPVMSTYSEWQSSSAAERGESCQHCHMSLVEADVVDPRVKRDAGASVNLHEMPGGHSLSQLNKALRVTVDQQRTDDGIEVVVDLENRGAGHAVPTGMPGRRIVLAVDVQTSDGRSFEEQRSFEKRFVDGETRQLDSVGDHFFAENLTLASDTRIAADAMARETFTFATAADTSAWVTVRLIYEHSPWGTNHERESLTFLTQRRLVRRER